MKKYNLLLVRCTWHSDYSTIWDVTALGWVVFCLAVFAACLALIFGVCTAWEKASCGDVAEVTGLDTTYRNIAGCFVEASEGVWISDDAYLVGKIQQIE